MSDFQTPDWCCDYMVSLLDAARLRPHEIRDDGNYVFEPTPGDGNLVRALEKKGYKVAVPLDDFYTFEWMTDRYDAVVMNPPFTPMQMGYDILEHCMSASDIVIALMPWLVIINSQKRTNRLKSFGLKSVTHLPRSTFKGSRVQCCVLELRKSWYGETFLRFV